MDDYEYYKLGCKTQGERSIGRKRFTAALARYKRDRTSMMARIDSADDRRKSMRLIVRWTKLECIMATLKAGKFAAGVLEPEKVVASTTALWEERPRTRQWCRESDEGDTGAPGVREPRKPIAPTLPAADARSLQPVYEYDRVIVQ